MLRDAIEQTFVRVLTTGGTIASRPGDGGVRATDGPDALLSSIAVGDVRLDATEVLRSGGYGMSERDLRAVASAVLDAAGDERADGIVVTHGTDTMEETAFLCALVHAGDAPVVFTGAQRNAAEADRDGPRNLEDAVRLAADPRARGIGVAVCMAGRAWPARHAVKADTLALDAFRAPGAGPVATVDGGRVRMVSRPAERPLLPASVLARPLPRVELLSAYAGADGTMVQAALDAGAQGLTVAGFGTGNVSPALAEALLDALAAGVPVVVSSRCASGATAPVYAGPGGAMALARAGAIFGGPLRPPHARLLLAAALACADGARDLARLIEPWT